MVNTRFRLGVYWTVVFLALIAFTLHRRLLVLVLCLFCARRLRQGISEPVLQRSNQAFRRFLLLGCFLIFLVFGVFSTLFDSSLESFVWIKNFFFTLAGVLLIVELVSDGKLYIRSKKQG